MRVGFAGRVAHAFLDSKLTPLIIAASLGLGALALLATPREEEPQIRVPMVDVMVAWPGAEPAEVENRVVAPIERILWGVPGVEHIYSVSRPGMGMVTVRFKVNESNEDSLVKVYERQTRDGLDHAAGHDAAHRRAALDRRRPLPRPHAVGRGLVERPAAAARRRARPGALRGPRGEPRPAHRRPAAGRARGAGPRPHGRRRDQLDAAHRRPPGGLRPPGRGHGRARQPRDPRRGRPALPQLGGDRPRGGRPGPGAAGVRVPGGARRRRARRDGGRGLLLAGAGRRERRGPGRQRARRGHDRPLEADRGERERAREGCAEKARGPAAPARPRRGPRRT